MLTVRPSRRSVLVAALTVTAVVAVAAPARADGYGGTVCSQQTGTASCTTTAGTTGSTGKPASNKRACHNADGAVVPCSLPGKGWYSAADGCYYRAATASEQPGAAAAGKRWFVGACGDPVNGFDNDFAALAQFGAAPGPEAVAQQAIAMLRLPRPQIRLSPAAAVQVVRVPSWLWIGDGTWTPHSATATTAGVSVTATAVPTSASWSTGDGATVTCAGPGTAWRASGDPGSSSPSCGHTYQNPSSGAGYRLSATITWAVTWVGAGQTGAAGPLTSTATTMVQVVQSSAVNVSDGVAS